MNKRRRLCQGIASLAAGLSVPGLTSPVAASTASRASPTKPLIIMVTYRGATDVERGFRDFLEKRGVQARYELFDIAQDKARFPAVIEAIRQLKPDLILCWGTTVTEALAGRWDQASPYPAAAALRGIPMVYAAVADPVAARLVPSLQVTSLHAGPGPASKGRGLTGVYHVAPMAKQMQALCQYRRPDRMLSAPRCKSLAGRPAGKIPDTPRIGVLYTPTERNAMLSAYAVQQQAQLLGFEAIAYPMALDDRGLPMTSSIPRGILHLASQGAQWLYLPPDSFLSSQAKKLVIPYAHHHGLPTFASTEHWMDAGALVGLISHYYEIGAFAAYKAWQILVEGHEPDTLPNETLSRYTLRINSAVAKQLALAPPLDLFKLAEF